MAGPGSLESVNGAPTALRNGSPHTSGAAVTAVAEDLHVPTRDLAERYVGRVKALADKLAQTPPAALPDGATKWPTSTLFMDSEQCRIIREKFAGQKVVLRYGEGEAWGTPNMVGLRPNVDALIIGLPEATTRHRTARATSIDARWAGDELLSVLGDGIDPRADTQAFLSCYKELRAANFPYDDRHKAALALSKTRNIHREVVGQFFDSEFHDQGIRGFRSFVLTTKWKDAFLAEEDKQSAALDTGETGFAKADRTPDPLLVFAEITHQPIEDMPAEDPGECMAIRFGCVEIPADEITPERIGELAARLDAAVAKQKQKGEAIYGDGTAGDPDHVPGYTMFTMEELNKIELPVGTMDAVQATIDEADDVRGKYLESKAKYERALTTEDPVQIYVAGMELIFAAAGDPSAPNELLRLSRTGINDLPAVLIFGDLPPDREYGMMGSTPAGPFNKNAGMVPFDAFFGACAVASKRDLSATATLRLKGGDFCSGGIQMPDQDGQDDHRIALNGVAATELNVIITEAKAWARLMSKAHVETRLSIHREEKFARAYPQYGDEKQRGSLRPEERNDFGMFGVKFFRFPQGWRDMTFGEMLGAVKEQKLSEPVRTSFQGVASIPKYAPDKTKSGRILFNATVRRPTVEPVAPANLA